MSKPESNQRVGVQREGEAQRLCINRALRAARGRKPASGWVCLQDLYYVLPLMELVLRCWWVTKRLDFILG